MDYEYRSLISDDWLRRESELRRLDHLILRQKDELSARCGVLVTYSHWEGQFKTSATALLNFISEGVRRKIFKWSDVREEVRLRLLFCRFRNSSAAGQNLETFTEYLNALNDTRFYDILSATDEIVLIDDNLSAARAEAICKNLGVDFAWCAIKKVTIDERLLAYRNALAHGSNRLRDGTEIRAYDQDVLQALSEVRELIRETKDRFSNALASRPFLIA